MEKTLDRLKKLLIAERLHREYGSLQEAEAAATLIQELLTKYNLELSDVEREVDRASNPFTAVTLFPWEYGYHHKPRRVKWSEDLANNLAYAYYVQAVLNENNNVMWLVGRKREVEVCQTVFMTLARTALRLMNKERETARKRCQRSGAEWGGNRLFRDSFFLGFNGAIQTRLEEQRRKLEIEAGNCTALVRLQDEAKNHVKETLGVREVGDLPTPEFTLEAYIAGVVNGQLAPIGAVLDQGEGVSPKLELNGDREEMVTDAS